MFELRRFTIRDGNVKYEDRTLKNSEPLVFRGIAMDLGVTPQSRAVYAYQMNALQPPLAQVSASGTMNLDTLLIELKEFAIAYESKRLEGESPLPPRVQQVVNELAIEGKIAITGSSELPLRDRGRAWTVAELKITDGRAKKLDTLNAAAHFEFRDGQTQLRIDQLSAQARNANLVLHEGNLRIADGTITWNLHGDALGGSVSADGTCDLRRPVKYDVNLSLAKIDLSSLPGDRSTISGTGNLTARLSGSIPPDGSPLDHLAGEGDAQVSNGRLLQSPMITGIAARVGIAPESLTFGDAAAVFSLRDRAFTIRRGAVNTQVLGLQGTGTINFDGDANLKIVAAPLGDWRKHVQGWNIPVVGDVAGDVAGQVQHWVTSASRALYAFEVKGKLSKPAIRPIPAPAVTGKTADAFGKMLQGVKSIDLLKLQKDGN
jgi:AsmA-like protein